MGGATAWCISDNSSGVQTISSASGAYTGSRRHEFTAYEAGEFPDLTYAAENAVKAVVNIEAMQQVEVQHRGQFGTDPFLEFFGIPQERPHSNGGPRYQQRKAGGSGVIISEEGYVVTNNHVSKAPRSCA